MYCIFCNTCFVCLSLRAGQPRFLQDLCRIKIRHCIGLQNLKLLDELPIARVMKDYLKHKYDDIWITVHCIRDLLCYFRCDYSKTGVGCCLAQVYPMQFLMWIGVRRQVYVFIYFFFVLILLSPVFLYGVIESLNLSRSRFWGPLCFTWKKKTLNTLYIFLCSHTWHRANVATRFKHMRSSWIKTYLWPACSNGSHCTAWAGRQLISLLGACLHVITSS